MHRGAFGLGVKNTDIYDPASGTFTSGPLLGEERWYPTNVTLPSGRVLVFGGFKDVDNSQKATTVDSYDPAANTVTALPATANKGYGNYPRLHLLANGKIAWTNQARTQLFNTATNTWAASALTNFGGRGESGSSILLPGSNKLLLFGGPNGSGGGSATAEIGDFSGTTPSWRAVGSLNSGRVWANGVLLPDGKVLAVGGGGGGAYTNPVKQAELFDPQTESLDARWPPSRARASTTRPPCCCPTAACSRPGTTTARSRRWPRSTRRRTCSRAAADDLDSAPVDASATAPSSTSRPRRRRRSSRSC